MPASDGVNQKAAKKHPTSIRMRGGDRLPVRRFVLFAGGIAILFVASAAIIAVVTVPSLERAENLFAAGNTDAGLAMLRRMADSGDIEAQKKVYQFLLTHPSRKDYETARKYMKLAAEAGDAQTQALLGKWHHDGLFGQQDSKTAVYWLTKASGQGVAESMRILSTYYFSGKTVVQDPERALNLLVAAVEKGDPGAAGLLGKLYYEGKYFPRDNKKAEQLLTRSDNELFPDRNRLLGLIYYHGLGTGRSLARAATLLSSVEDTDDPETNAVLGLMYFHGEGFVPSASKAEKHLRKAADGGVATAYVPLGMLYYEGIDGQKDFPAAARYFTLAEKAGETGGGGKLGVLTFNGLGVEKDAKKAVELMTAHALKHRDTEVNALLGRIYFHGDDGVPQDYHKAYAYLQLAAEAQDRPSQTLLAHLYYHGNGVARDYVQALRYLQRGVEAKDASALSLYGRMLYYGDGGERDKEQGLAHLLEARDLGDQEARDFLVSEEQSRQAVADIQLRPPVAVASAKIETAPPSPAPEAQTERIALLPAGKTAYESIFLWGDLQLGMGLDESIHELNKMFRFAPKDVVRVKNYPEEGVEAYLVYVGDWAVRLLLEKEALSNVEFFAVGEAAPEPALPREFKNKGVYLPYALHSKEGGIEFDIFDPEAPVYQALQKNPEMSVRELAKTATFYLADCIKRANRRFDVIEARMPEDFNFADKDIPTSAMEFHYSLEPDIVKKASWQPDGKTPGYISYSTGLMFGM